MKRMQMGIVCLLAGLLGTGPTASSAADLGNIWPLGDSITYGAAVPASVPGGYRDSLYTNLVGRGYTFRFVGTRNVNSSTRLTTAGQQWHDGWSGYGIMDFSYTNSSSQVYNYSGLYDQVAAWHGSLANQPDIILLMIGINDLNQRYDETGAPNRLDNLLTLLFSLDSDLRILVSTLPVATSNNAYRHNPPNNDLPAEIDSYNTSLASLVAARRALGQSIELVDMHAGLTLADLSDGLHPNAGGYVKMADIWADAIEAVPPAFTTNAIDVSAGTVTLEAEGNLGASYSLWTAPGLATNTAWTMLAHGNVTTNPFAITVPVTNAQLFYRFAAP